MAKSIADNHFGKLVEDGVELEEVGVA